VATFAESLISSYARAKARDSSLRKGQYMQRVFPERYKNEDSAYQAYNQTTKGKRTGKKLAALSTEAQPPIRNKQLVLKGKRRPRPAGHRRGLWKINVKFTYIDGDGEEYQETRSFVGISQQYTTLLDVPYIEEIILGSVDEYIDYWIENDSLRGNYTNKEVEVVPIYRYDTDAHIDLDQIDQLVIEDYR
jgi:hypothetical protein